MAALYAKLDKYVKEMSEDELKAIFSNSKQSYIMRSLIMNEKEFSTVSYTRTLRSLWYSTIKPTLDKLGLLTEKDSTEESLTKWDAELSRYMADLVRKGFITYRDLNIVDQSRQKDVAGNIFTSVDISTYGYQIGHGEYKNIILATEKDTAYNILLGLAKLFGCSCISGKGQNSLGAMESLLRQIGKSYEKIYILTMTDYDPSGYYIAETFKNQVEDLKPALGLEFDVFIERVGITPDQLTPEEVAQNKYTPKPANIEKWMKVTGGINGEPKGLELDAFSPDRIREIFVTSLKNYIDQDNYSRIVRESYIRKSALEALGPKIDSLLKELVEELESKLNLKSFSIVDLALQGYSYLPIGSLCDGNLDYIIQEKVLEHFA